MLKGQSTGKNRKGRGLRSYPTTPEGSGSRRLRRSSYSATPESKLFELEEKPLPITKDPEEIAKCGFAPCIGQIEGTSAGSILDLGIWNRITRASEIKSRTNTNFVTRVMLKQVQPNEKVIPGAIDNYTFSEYLTRPRGGTFTASDIAVLGNKEKKYLPEERNKVFKELQNEIIPLKKSPAGIFKFESEKQKPETKPDFAWAILLSATGELVLLIAEFNHIFVTGMTFCIVAGGDGFLVDRKDNPNEKVISLTTKTGAYKPTKEFYEREDGVKLYYTDTIKKAVDICFGEGVELLEYTATPTKHHSLEVAQSTSKVAAEVVQTDTSSSTETLSTSDLKEEDVRKKDIDTEQETRLDILLSTELTSDSYLPTPKRTGVVEKNVFKEQQRRVQEKQLEFSFSKESLSSQKEPATSKEPSSPFPTRIST